MLVSHKTMLVLDVHDDEQAILCDVGTAIPTVADWHRLG